MQTLRWRRHAEHVLAARADDHEIVRAAAAAQMRFDVGDDLELATARPHRLTKLRICLVGDPRGRSHRLDLAAELVHEQLVEQRRRVIQYKAARRIGEPTRQESSRRRGKPLVGDTVKPRADGADDIRREMHRDARRLELRRVRRRWRYRDKARPRRQQTSARCRDLRECRNPRHSAGSRPARRYRRATKCVDAGLRASPRPAADDVGRARLVVRYSAAWSVLRRANP